MKVAYSVSLGDLSSLERGDKICRLPSKLRAFKSRFYWPTVTPCDKLPESFVVS